MPKPRQTCTRCSMRRQKCDRKLPCTRCVRDGEGDSCSRHWPGGYNSKIHRTYLKSRPKDQASSTPVGSSAHDAIAVPTNDSRDTSPAYGVPTAHEGSNGRPASGSHYGPQTQYRDYADAIGERNILRPMFAPSPSSPSSGRVRYNANSTPSATGSVFSPNTPGADFSRGQQPRSANDSKSESTPHIMEREYLQTLIPTETQIYQMVEYHEANLLWNYGCLNGPKFREELREALFSSSGFLVKHRDLRWCALLFAIMATTLTCAPESRVRSWGFSKPQRRNLSKQWYKGAISCLNLADYMSRIHMNSVQTILVLSLCAHAIGFSSEQFIYFGTALKIAQSLNIQRLSEDPELDNFGNGGTVLSKSDQNRLADRELGRRLWAQLCITDWFSIPSSGMYSINKRHFSTCLPHRVLDETMCWADESTPLTVDYRNHLNGVAALMAEFHDATCQLPEYSAEKYKIILDYDLKLRALMPDPIPKTKPGIQEPQWMRWARGISIILQAHKIIMMHRGFLGKSFTDPQYAYSRWASLASSKIILYQVDIAITDSERPWLWIDQAHLVSAGMTLCLDIVHRHDSDPEFAENLRLVDKAISLLGRFDDSTLALRGVRILSSLLKEGTSNRKTLTAEAVTQPHPDGSNSWPLERHQSYNGDSVLSTAGAGGPTTSEQSHLVATQTSIPTDSSGVVTAPLYPAADFNSMDMTSSVGMMYGGGGILDTPWDDLFSDFFPAQNGFDELLAMQ